MGFFLPLSKFVGGSLFRQFSGFFGFLHFSRPRCVAAFSLLLSPFPLYVPTPPEFFSLTGSFSVLAFLVSLLSAYPYLVSFHPLPSPFSLPR